MTKTRGDNYSTEFGLWTREQDEIDSSLGYVATDIDWMWRDYNTDNFMFIEEKRFMKDIEFWQKKSFDIIHKKFVGDKKYKGFHLLQFENTNPEDGKIFLNRKEITKEQLINFLKFNKE